MNITTVLVHENGEKLMDCAYYYSVVQQQMIQGRVKHEPQLHDLVMYYTTFTTFMYYMTFTTFMHFTTFTTFT